MYETPLIRPACGEIVLAWSIDTVLLLPVHPDRVWPAYLCGLRVAVRQAGRIHQF